MPTFLFSHEWNYDVQFIRENKSETYQATSSSDLFREGLKSELRAVQGYPVGKWNKIAFLFFLTAPSRDHW